MGIGEPARTPGLINQYTCHKRQTQTLAHPKQQLSSMSDGIEEHRCRHCGFKTTTSGRLSSHISQSPACLRRIVADNQPRENLRKRDRSPTPGVADDPSIESTSHSFPTTSFLDDQRPTKHARIEVEDIPFNKEVVIDEFDPPAGVPRQGANSKSVRMVDVINDHQENQPWAPFASTEEWDYARWIILESDLSQKQINNMLALDLVSESQTPVNE